MFGLVYVPPQNSPYADITLFDKLENVISEVNNSDNYSICILGDFNARCGTLSDVLVYNDEAISEISLLDVFHDNLTGLNNVTSDRPSSDTVINNFGHRLLELCTNLGVFIANGRYGNDKGVGKATCKGVSLVDYVLLTSDLFNYVSNFDVLPFDMLISDVHQAVTFTFRTNHVDENVTVVHTEGESLPPRPAWSAWSQVLM